MSAASTNDTDNNASTTSCSDDGQHSLQSNRRRAVDAQFVGENNANVFAQRKLVPMEVENDEDGEDEMIGLLKTYAADFKELQARKFNLDDNDSSSFSGAPKHVQSSGRRRIMILLAATAMYAVLFLLYRSRHSIQDYIRTKHLPVQYSCPRKVKHSQNDKDNAFDIYEIKNKEYYLSHYRQKDYGGWGITYAEMKDLLIPWKTEVFAPNLKNGDVIYESAMGRGLNLLITSEILNDLSINDLAMYGNDYLPNSVNIANSIWDLEENRIFGRKGIFCSGDSTNLRFAPASSFDLVYSGYIDPIVDPLGLDSDGSSNTEIAYCLSDKPKEKAIAARAQGAQEDWYERWVLEMIRLVKRGGVVAIEMTGFPLCESYKTDWGGVSKEWWNVTAISNGWDIDVNSIVIRDCPKSRMWNMNRYHVSMRRKG